MRRALPLVLAIVTAALGAAAQPAPSPPTAVPADPPTVTTVSMVLEARLTEVRGEVEVTADGAHPGRPGEVLGRGARVRTGAGSTAVLSLPNGATLSLAEHSQLVLFAAPTAPPPGVPPSTMTTLVRGTLRIGSAPGNDPRTEQVPVNTLAATVFIGRADAVLAADLGGHIARIGVYRGRLRVRTPAREYLLPAGLGVLEEMGRPPPPFRLLPRPPTWRTAPPARVLSLGELVDVSGTYGPAAGGGFAPAGWRVQVARDESFRDLVSDARVPAGTTRWTGHTLAPGAWFVRVYALDIDRFESGASPVARINIAAPGLLDGSAGTGSPGRCAAIQAPRGFYCGLDGSTLAPAESPITLAPGRSHRLRCAASPDGRGARESTITAEQSGPLLHEVRLAPPVAGATGAEATGEITVLLRDAEDRPVPFATVEATATQGVTVGSFQETAPRGGYLALMRWPPGVRATRLRVAVNSAVTFEQDAAVSAVTVASPAPSPSRRGPVTFEVIRAPVPHEPDDDDEVTTP